MSAGVSNIPAGGEYIITALTTICNKIWQTGEWPTPWTQSLVTTLPMKGNLQQCQNYRTISLNSHPSKVMLKIILNRLKPQAENSSLMNRQASEQEGAPQSRFSTYTFSVKNISSTSTTSTIDFKKAFNRVWHVALVGNHEEVQHQCQPYSSHQKPLFQGH